MILVRSPLRITLGGGGTDLPSYANQFGGFCLTAAIDKYVYVSAMRPFTPGIFLKYSALEHVETIDAVHHPIIREALRALDIPPQIELTTLADIPAGTGLGSSSSFTTALLQALVVFQVQHPWRPKELAENAAAIEMQRLGEPIGKQDAYSAAFGGFPQLTIGPNGAVTVAPLLINATVRAWLEDGLLLFYTGLTRQARSVLYQQRAATIALTDDALQRLHTVKARGLEARRLLQAGQVHDFGLLLHEHWQEKRSRTPGMSTPQIDAWYDLARATGAIGGKLVGAGAGGCLLFYTEHPRRLRAGLAQSGLEEIRFRFDFEGTKMLVSA